MAVTPSAMIPLGTPAPEFHLPATNGKTVSLDDFAGKQALLIIFMCNHCPFVKHLQRGLVEFANEYMPKGVAVVGINSNDTETHPDDSFERMKEEVDSVGYPFPYLFDETQEVAKKYHATCTPDFFLFDGDRKLVYRGQFDDSRPGNQEPVTGKDMRHAVEQVLNGEAVKSDQKPSMGCNIKWKPGNEPDYFNVQNLKQP